MNWTTISNKLAQATLVIFAGLCFSQLGLAQQG